MNFIQEVDGDESILGLHFALGGEGKVGNTSDEECSQQLSLNPGTLVGTLGGHTDVQQGLHRGDLVAVALCLANIGIALLVEETHLHVATATLLDILHPAQLRREGRGGLARLHGQIGNQELTWYLLSPTLATGTTLPHGNSAKRLGCAELLHWSVISAT